VWRGGVCIYARAVLKAYGVTDRRVWLADSFQGIPDPGEGGHAMDKEMALHESNHVLGVSMETVERNFESYGLLDDQVRFLPGWFRDSLPTAPIERLAVVRLDGDLYESTMDALTHLYGRLSPGGFVIVDDYCIPACRKAVEEFREAEGIEDPLEMIDDYSAFWRRGVS
jgi:Macrocin-O-methyltransferase (TylF)